MHQNRYIIVLQVYMIHVFYNIGSQILYGHLASLNIMSASVR